MRPLDIYLNPRQFWKSLSRLRPKFAFLYLLYILSFLLIVFAFSKLAKYTSILVNLSKISITNQLYLNVLSLFFLFAVLIIVLIIISTFLNTILKIYKVRSNIEKSAIIVFYSFVSGLILYFLVSLIPFADNSILRMLITFYIFYSLYLGVSKFFRTPKVTSISSIAILGVFVYIYYLREVQVIIVYTASMFLIYLLRHKFDEEKVVLLLKTTLGITSMDKIAKKMPRTLKFLADIGIVIGYLSMILITGFIVFNVYQLFFVPKAIPGLSPVLPGIKIPGSPIVLPLWYGILSIFIVAAIHEFSHGVIARLHKLKIKKTGLVLLGPFVGGAFVDVDEKALTKSKKRHQLQVLGAGPFSNLLTGGIFLLLFLFVLSPAVISILEPDGVRVSLVDNDTAPSVAGGLPNDIVITSINNNKITTIQDFMDFVNKSEPNQSVTIIDEDGTTYPLVLGSHPDNSTLAYFGIHPFQNTMFKPNIERAYGKITLELLLIFYKFMFWLWVISIGIGTANLLPIGPVDGGRMFYVAMQKFFNEKKAKMLWERLSAITLGLIILIILIPIFKDIFSSLT